MDAVRFDHITTVLRRAVAGVLTVMQSGRSRSHAAQSEQSCTKGADFAGNSVCVDNVCTNYHQILRRSRACTGPSPANAGIWCPPGERCCTREIGGAIRRDCSVNGLCPTDL